MKQSRLHEHHIKLGATFTDVGGWTVPAHYGDVVVEYAAIRQAVGLADLCPRGRLRVTGDDRVKWLQSIISNDILPLQPGQGVYSSLLTHKGKMLTYFRVYAQPDAMLVEDVGEIGETTFQSLRKFLLYGTKAKLESLTESTGLLLVSGPKADELLQAGLGADTGTLRAPGFLTHEVDGAPIAVMKTEETGHTDIELLVPADRVVSVWERLCSAGRPFGLQAVGTEACEVLRIEAGLPKAGVDLTEEIVPPEANLEGKAFSLSKGCYPGQEVVARMDTYGNVRRRLVGLLVESQTVPPAGAKLYSGDREVGWISSAAYSPSFKCPIALGFPLRDFSQPDTHLAIDVGGRRYPTTVKSFPLPRPA